MYCPNCGAPISDDSSFCPYCGTGTQASPQGSYTPQGSYSPHPAAAPAVAEQKPMKWFKFLIYFSLFASAFLNGINGFRQLTGSIYGDEKELIYDAIEGLQALDMFVGAALIALAALAIFTRFRLAGYHKNGPDLVTLMYASTIIINVIYYIGIAIVLPDDIADAVNTSSLITGSLTSIAMIFINKTYFEKRASLFVNP